MINCVHFDLCMGHYVYHWGKRSIWRMIWDSKYPRQAGQTHLIQGGGCKWENSTGGKRTEEKTCGETSSGEKIIRGSGEKGKI